MNKIFAGLAWWEIALCGLPLILLFVGGAIGGLVGALGLALNLKIWKGKSSQAVKIGLVLGVAVLSFIAYTIAVTIFFSALGM